MKRPVVATNGYLRTCIFKDSRGKGVFIHRLVAAAFLGERPEGMQVNHKNGNKQDNRLENLEYVTASDNALHARRVLGRGPDKRGSKHHLAKWGEDEILAMRQLLASGLSQADVMRIFGISSASISRVANRVRWTHI